MAESKKEMALRAERAEVALRVMEAERAELAAHARLLAAVEDAKARETEATLDTPTFLRVNSADANEAVRRQHQELVALQVRLRALRELEYVATARVHAVVKPHRFYGGGPAITDEGKAQRADDVVASAERGLSSIPSWVPRRICDEEIGDALEYIAAVSRRGAPGWERDVRRKVWSTKLWVLCNAVREVVRAALGKQGA